MWTLLSTYKIAITLTSLIGFFSNLEGKEHIIAQFVYRLIEVVQSYNHFLNVTGIIFKIHYCLNRSVKSVYNLLTLNNNLL